jgi:nicotinamide mononucleotide transporter
MEKVKSNLFRSWVDSPYLDLVGVGLVLGITILKNYHSTLYFDREIIFNPTWEQWKNSISQGAYPLGVLTAIGAIFSLLSTRLVGRQKNSGNVISIFSTVNSGLNDFLLGNTSAIITYPVSFFSHVFSSYSWFKGQKIRKPDGFFYFLNIIGLLVGYGLVYLGFSLFEEKDFIQKSPMLFHSISISFGLSINGNFANIFKYRETFLSWMIYNIVQLVKNSLLLNIPNVGKYIFYLINAIFTFFDWKFNGDREKGK